MSAVKINKNRTTHEYMVSTIKHSSVLLLELAKNRTGLKVIIPSNSPEPSKILVSTKCTRWSTVILKKQIPAGRSTGDI